MLLAVRVRDESLRDTVQRFRRLTSGTEAIVRDADDAELRDRSSAALQEAMPLLEEIHEQTGHLLRTLDDEEADLTSGAGCVTQDRKNRAGS
jgi:hypothetical protein